MHPEEDYININKNSWNNRTEIHLHSEFYDMEGFKQGKTSLNPIELDLLGNIKGKKVLHLQCHFGQDTISLARMGAIATGIDLSDKAIDTARELAESIDQDVRFICCNIYDLKDHLEEQFDIVFTSYGTITWLPDMNQWADIVQHFLKPGGKFILIEFHPVVWMFDDAFEKVGYNYFNSGPIVETETGTYADRGANICQTYVGWNHSMSEVLQSLLDQNLQIQNFQEYDYSPYNIFNNGEEFEPNKFRVSHMANKIPLVYSVVAEKE